MTIYHKHHIIPKHAGGSDDPSNLIELTIEEHAEAHRVLYEQHSRPQDYAAWKALSGMMSKQEVIKYLQKQGAKILSEKRKKDGTHPWLGDKNPSKKKVSNGTHHFQQNVGNRPADIVQRKLVESNEHYWQSEDHAKEVGVRSRRLISSGEHPFGRLTKCPNCNKTGQLSAMKRWHFSNCASVSS